MTKISLLRRLLLPCLLFLLPLLGFSQLTRDWIKRYNGTGHVARDEARAVAVDGSGNVYVAGISEDNFTTIKYGSDGSQKWVKKYSRAAGARGVALAIKVDGAGGINVAGWTTSGPTAPSDFTTIKYGSDGSQKWVRHYNGPGNGVDQVTTLAADGSGNVYVTGYSMGTSTDKDYATLKYDNSGNLKWAARYDHGGEDQPHALAVDGGGNVYVTGASKEGGTTWRANDFATVKYTSGGVEQWVKRYDGTLHGSDQAKALAVDGAGNVYVAGNTTVYLDEDGEDWEDFATLKYNATGGLVWERILNRRTLDSPKALVVDGSGNVLVAGSSGDHEESTEVFTTFKYNAAGALQWVSTLDGTVDESDWVHALNVDGSGNVYVTGETRASQTSDDYLTVKYNSLGAQLWVARYNGFGAGRDHALAATLDGSGNLYVTGASAGSCTEEDFATLKYNASGNISWVRRFNAPGTLSNDAALAIGYDASGNVYLTGRSTGEGTGSDYVTSKFGPDGTRLWVLRYNGPGNGDDEARAMAVDASGNVHVTGPSRGAGFNEDLATIKYDKAGAVKWTKRYDGPDKGDDYATAVCLDAGGNVYVTGYSTGAATGRDYITLKYSKDGAQLWAARYNGPANGKDEAAAIAVDAGGNVYVTGESQGDYTTVKYNASGAQQWVTRVTTPSLFPDRATAIALDAGGNVYITGYNNYYSNNNDYLTIKYNSAGVQQWQARYHVLEDFAWDLAVDGSGNVYVTGGSNGNYATLKYNAAGSTQWVSTYNGDGDQWGDAATALALDGGGNVYVTGKSSGSGSGYDYATLKYNAAGVQQWVDRFNGTGNGDDAATALAVSSDGHVYVAGVSIGSGTGNDYLPIQYAQASARAITGREETVPGELSAAFRLSHFPNPVAATARIRYELPVEGQVSLKLYDLLGREVRTLVNASAKAGVYTAEVDASPLREGVYYYTLRLESGTGVWVTTNKMIRSR
ncbi:SBBP repeat-containing protein [Paraflavisolibacter sp. H34]|uniref:SBBP repeat-containing protein n=1 Tax=Huijunlia imazamoxiresistens TaxID=3127457 RepID=UPI0030180B28